MFMAQGGANVNDGQHASPEDLLFAAENKRLDAERQKARRAASKAAVVSARPGLCSGVLARLRAYAHHNMFGCAHV